MTLSLETAGKKLLLLTGPKASFVSISPPSLIPFVMHSHQRPLRMPGRLAVFTSKLEVGPQSRYLTSLECTSAKPGEIGEQEGLYNKNRTAGEPRAFA